MMMSTMRVTAMTNKLEERWNVLKFDPLCPVFQLVDASHPLDFYIGKDSNNQRLLLLVTPESPPILKDMRAIRIRKFKRDDGKWSLLLTLDSSSLEPMFSLLCDDLIEASRNTGQAPENSLSSVLRRLASWRRLLERGLSDILSESEIRGLCGELLFLRRLFGRFSLSASVDAWVGPKLADQDFQMPKLAWEIKTTRPEAEFVTISSEAQLQTSIRSVYLVVIELADGIQEHATAFSLNTLVEMIRASLADDFNSGDRFEELLSVVGYVTRPEYGRYFFEESSVAAYNVGNVFPRITGETVPSGVRRVSYDIKLSECETFLVDMESIFE